MIALLSFMFLTTMAFGQGAGVSLTGTVQDASGAVVPGASVVARNVDTGVETRTTSNDRGSYTFPSLQVGNYEISAEAPGFARFSRSGIRLSVGSQPSLNITLAVAGTVTTVDVTGAAESVILEAGASTGTLMQEEILMSVPMLTTNVMDLINLMGGVTPTSDPSMNPGAQTFAGVSAGNINIQRDGMTVSEVSMNTGINASTSINTEMIGEFKMVLSPVDAEMGRGAGQVQMTTRSGSNAFHGSAVWNNQNTALDAKDFSTKNGNIGPPWRNLNTYMLTASGPIVRNKTFFFVTWEHQISRVKLDYTARAMTNCARVGIYRYIGGANPYPATVNNAMTVGSNNMPSVDLDGNILTREYANKNNVTFLGNSGATAGQTMSYDEVHPSVAVAGVGIRSGDGDLHFESVFGPLSDGARRLIEQDVTDRLNPCAAFAASQYWDPNPNDPNNPARFGVDRLWDWDTSTNQIKPWGTGYDGRTGRAYRSAFDTTGYVNRFTYNLNDGSKVRMPPVNYFSGNGDGLNIASHRWTRSGIGGREGTIYGTGGDPDRKSLTFKIDHNINNNHRVSGTYTHENFETDEHEAIWPEEYGGMGGRITRAPRNLNASLTSTLRPTLLNEFRFGYMKADIWTRSAINYSPELRNTLEYLLPKEQSKNQMTLIGIGEGLMDFFTDSQTYNWESHPVGSRGNISASQGREDGRWSFADTVTWMKGAHSFKGGVEYRRQHSVQSVDGGLAFGRFLAIFGGGYGSVTGWPSIFGGANAGTTDRRTGMLGQDPLTKAGENWTNLTAQANSNRDCHSSDCPTPGTNGTSGRLFTTPYQMMTYFAGSTSYLTQYFYMVPDASKQYGARWNDVTKPNEDIYSNNIINQELSFFFKDDWKVSNSLTLNLGVRWEYYGVPYAADGRTLALAGGSKNIFGASTPVNDVSRFMLEKSLRSSEYKDIAFGGLNGGNAADLPMETRYEYVGPGSPKSDRMAWNKDMNNFAPHLGFAWQLPWLGRGLTTLRGGWSISYATLGSQDTFNGWIANVSAAQPTYNEIFRGESVGGASYNVSGSTLHYMDLEDLGKNDPTSPLPMHPRGGREPLKPLVTGYFSGTATAIDENLHSPLTHSLNVSLTRNIGRVLTVDVRYIGTLGREQIVSTNINQNDYINTGLAEEFERLRTDASYQSPLINSLIPKGRYNTSMRDYFPTLSGSEQLRNSLGGGNDLTQRAYNTIAGNLLGNGGYTPDPTLGEGAMLFRNGCLPDQRPGYLAAYANDPTVDAESFPCQYHTPLNYLRSNPQHGTANLQTNLTKSNYHSMQTQITLRPTHGLNFQATWTWSRALSDAGWTNYLGERTYTLTGQHRSHTLNVFGSYELPFGPRGLLLRESPSAVRKIVEGWQLGWVTAIRSGSPTSITGNTTQWGTSYPILVRPDLWDNKAGKGEAIWAEDGTFAGGRYFGDNKYTRVMDPGVCGGSLIQSLYNNHCYDNAANQVRGTTRAIALADPNGAKNHGGVALDPETNAPWAALYDKDTLGDDGVMYKAGTPIIIFRNATGDDKDGKFDPLSTGNYRSNSLTNPGQFTLDANLSKSVEFMEGKRLEIRIDAANILNHPSLTGTAAADQRYMYGGRVVNTSDPGNLGLNVAGNATIGNLPGKVGHRTFQARLALRF